MPLAYCDLIIRVPSRAEHEIKEEIPNGISSFIWYTGRDSNPQPSEPESDALSIEPPVHLLYSLVIIAGFSRFVKGAFWKNRDFLSTYDARSRHQAAATIHRELKFRFIVLFKIANTYQQIS